MKCFLSSLAIVAAVAVSGSLAADKCHLRELDLCAASAAGATKIPANDADIDKYCETGKEAKECVETYMNNCATPIQKELFVWATKDPFKNTADFCKKGSAQRNDYLRHAPCLAKAQPEGKKCIDDVHAGLEKVEAAAFKDRIPTACCLYTRYLKCTGDIVEAKCGKEAIDQAHGLLSKNAGASLQLLCNGYSHDTPACASLLPAPGTKAKGNSKSIVGKLFSAYVSA